MNRSRIAGMAAVCAALLLEGCAFRRLGRDLEVVEGLKVVSGTIGGEVGEGKPVVVVLWSLDDADPSGYSVGYRGKPGMHFGAENNDGTVPLSSQLAWPAQESASRVSGFHADHVGILSDEVALGRLNGALIRKAEELRREG